MVTPVNLENPFVPVSIPYVDLPVLKKHDHRGKFYRSMLNINNDMTILLFDVAILAAILDIPKYLIFLIL